MLKDYGSFTIINVVKSVWNVWSGTALFIMPYNSMER